MDWNPGQYERYADERGRPFLDLLARVPASAPRRVVDVGCGTGALTAVLATRWPAAQVEGFDSSPEMIDAAAPLADDRLRFRLGDVHEWTPPPDADVVVSNAVLQWVPDHDVLLRAWFAALPAGGTLAWQVPGNFASPSHAIMREVAALPRWAGRLDGVLRGTDPSGSPAHYASVLLAEGAQVDTWETTYLHVLRGEDPVLQWVRGTGLRPVLAALADDPGALAAFEAEYAARLRSAYPPHDGVTLFAFRRVFAVAHKPGGAS